MKIATYNINGINGRLPVLLKWLKGAQPDVVCLQELKCQRKNFPIDQIRAAGYSAVWDGEPSWNGVAILSHYGEPVVTLDRLPNDQHARYIEAAVNGVLIGCLYAPNGNPRPGPKFDYKLDWLKDFQSRASDLVETDAPIVLAGDYNIIPEPDDVYAPERWLDDALYHFKVRRAFQELIDGGWTDSLRTMHPDDEQLFTFWDYKRNAWQRNAGLRLDHLLLSPVAAPRLRDAGVDRQVRGWEHSSDHAPVWIEIA